MAASTGPVSVTASTSSAVMKAANSERVGLQVFNIDTASNLYLAYAATCSTTFFTVKIAPGGYWEMPYAQETAGSVETIYQGVVSGVWDGTPTGAAVVTETYIGS